MRDKEENEEKLMKKGKFKERGYKLKMERKKEMGKQSGKR